MKGTVGEERGAESGEGRLPTGQRNFKVREKGYLMSTRLFHDHKDVIKTNSSH